MFTSTHTHARAHTHTHTISSSPISFVPSIANLPSHVINAEHGETKN